MKRITFAVTNDLNHDQRMMRICNSLAEAGYQVTLVGTKFRHSAALLPAKYGRKRLFCPFRKGFLFYPIYNCILFFYLLFKPTDVLCCIDLDTMLPVWLAGKIKGTRLVYDAHEYFTQQKEVLTRPGKYRIWHWIEKTWLPLFKHGYTVSSGIAGEFRKTYGVNYEVIRNLPLLMPLQNRQKERIILYQGAVNEARGLEYLVPAMKYIDAPLHIYGDGNFVLQTKELVKINNLADQVLLKGKLLPEQLATVTSIAYIGINLVENNGLNQYLSLANKFFDYLHCGLPQVSMNFPEYRRVNDEFEVALLIDEPETLLIAAAVNRLLNDEALYERLHQNCLEARKVFNWQEEEKKLIRFYQKLFADS